MLKKTLKYTVILLLLLFAGFVGYVIGLRNNYISNRFNNPYINEMEVEPENFMPDFTEINHTVKENYSHLKNKQINIDSLFLLYSERLKTISNKEDYGKLLVEYFAELKNGHTNLCLSTYSLNAKAKLIEGRIFIDKLDDSLRKKGIEEKDEILEINHIPAPEWIKQQEKYVGASTDTRRLEQSVDYFAFKSYFDKERIFLIKTKQGNKEITLPLLAGKKNVESSVIQDSIGYIAINSMMNDVLNQFNKEFKQVQTKPVLIIDIRTNGGGNSDNSEKITQYLIKKQQEACVSRTTLTPEKNYYKGKLYLLIGTETFSAAESFALDLKESGNVVLIGSPTSGDTGNHPENFTTKQGTSFRIPTRKPAQISPKGFPMEGVGISPDYEVFQTLDDYLKDKDTVLEYTINNLIVK